MKDFKIEIRETLAREISVKADSYEEALEKVKNDYFDEEIVLYGDDFSRVEFVEAWPSKFLKILYRVWISLTNGFRCRVLSRL